MRPAKQKILGKRWTVGYVKGEPLGKDEMGVCDIQAQEIHILDGLKPEQEKSTLLHEDIHAISDTLGLGLTEKQVQGLEAGIFDLNMNNPGFFAWLRRKK